MTQSRRHSAIEATTNIATGYVISWAASLVIFPLIGIQSSPGQNALAGLAFTGVSLARSYAVRRLFNRFGSLTTCLYATKIFATNHLSFLPKRGKPRKNWPDPA